MTRKSNAKKLDFLYALSERITLVFFSGIRTLIVVSFSFSSSQR